MSSGVDRGTLLKRWANFFEVEKLNRKGFDGMKLLYLAEKLADMDISPKFRPHTQKIETRRIMVNAAMDIGFDMTKTRIGRGTLDVWNEEYAKRYGSVVGTPGDTEAKRREIVTRLSRKEEHE